ncbi:ABC-type antimicrobial peptide transport system permease subunit [Actinocorallia herbida]|uniref:ABC-type antimicrobial peptide transport system permease subunit n=1 Tax=Actinocorallia herbida TaxID=58109 RepID=A0A3N1CNX6_9ACTN|nr:ABC-type antimicrobial peptide transport system permease subunit [Actinocorallia herbida]
MGKVRVILSTFCVACLVGTVTIAAAISYLTQQMARQFFEQQAGRPGTMSVSVEFKQIEEGAGVSVESFTEVQNAFARYKITASPIASIDTTVRTPSGEVLSTQGRNSPPQFMINGADSSLADIRALKIIGGRWLTETDDLRLEPSLVVSQGFLRTAGIPRATALDTTLQIATGGHWTRARIVGVLDIGQEWGPGGEQTGSVPQVYLPAESVIGLGLPIMYSEFVMRVPPETAKRTGKQIREDAKHWTGVMGVSVSPQFGDFGQIGRSLRLIMYGAALGMLLLGSLPVIALGIFAVRQRRSEFGVHRCFGATGPDLFFTVLLEALITCTAAGLVGVLGAFVVTGRAADFVLRRQLPGVASIDTSFPWEAAQLGLGVAVCVGLFTGLIPAWRAMQKSVIRAIRA